MKLIKQLRSDIYDLFTGGDATFFASYEEVEAAVEAALKSASEEEAEDLRGLLEEAAIYDWT